MGEAREIPNDGLSAEEARARLGEFGPNELSAVVPFRSLFELFRLFANPLIVILLVASGISVMLGQILDAALVAAMVLLGLALNFLQTYRSARALERLRQVVSPTSMVIREGKQLEVARREIVPGDLLQLSAGDLVPADAVLQEARDLHFQEAALTGESLPVEKEAGGRIFFGSSVVSGLGRAVVKATGARTEYGAIAARLAARAPETDFDRGTRRFGVLIMETVFALVVFVFLANAMRHRDLVESLLFSVALAVGLTPEFLPVITAVTLSRGAVRMAKSQVIVKHLSAMQNFGSIDVLCSDKTGTLTSGEMQLQDSLDPFGAPSAETLRLGYLSSFFESGIRSPLDFAILRTGKKDLLAKRKIDEIPFDFERRRLSVVVTEGESSLLVTKGAPESVLPLCSRFRKGKEIAPFREEDAARAEETHRRFADAGTRVLAVAWREVSEKEYPFAKDDERDLVLEGFLTFLDPPLPGLPELMRGLRRDGIRIKVLTGDNELVARHVCADLGFSSVAVVSGQEIERMTDAALAHVVEENDIFARVSPAHKNRIILALKGRRHVVGFLGDGINDAPSLHAADVGISFSSAVDVAREAADIILLRRDLKVLHEGILEGRRAFGNVVKYLLMGTSSNFGNMLSMALASAFLPFLPMLPLQILLNNFLYDLAQITIPTDQVDPSFMHKPRHWDISLVRDFMVIVGPLSSVYDFLTFFALLRIFHFTNALFRTGWFLESLVTQTLVIFIIRTGGGPFASHSSRPLRITVLTVVTVGVLLPYAPFATELGFAPLPLAFFPFLFAVTATYLVFVELVKRRVLRRIYV